MRITIVGTGYVGLVTGTCLANTGNVVTCLDVDQKKIDRLNQGISPIFEPGLDQLIQRNVKANRLFFTTDKEASYRSAEAVFICVGTPTSDSGEADLSYVLGVATDIGKHIEAGPGPSGSGESERRGKIVIVKSTVPVGTNARVKAEIANHTAKPFHMASNPEFLKEGAAIADFAKPDRVVIGVEDRGVGERLRRLYEPYVRQGNPIFIMDIQSAEMVKYAANTMLATKISFINEIANLCEHYGADIDEVRRGMCSDSRIGNKFLFPGLGYGGSCFPKDVAACIAMGDQSGRPAEVLRAVNQVNQAQRQRFIDRIERHYDGGLAGKKFAVWGLAFKPMTDDMREAPSVTIIEHLLSKGATVTGFDPVAKETAAEVFGDRVALVDAELDALDGADALIICNESSEFRHPDFDEVKRRLAGPVIFDGRNLYRLEDMQEHGLTYYSIGRPDVMADAATPAATA